MPARDTNETTSDSPPRYHDRLRQGFRRLLRRRWAGTLLVVLTTATGLAGVHFLFQKRLEDRQFRRFVSRTVTDDMGEREKALALMHQVHEVMWATKPIFTRKLPPGITEPPWYPIGTDYLRDAGRQLGAAGGCGSFSLVLARSFEEAGIEYRVAHMICMGTRPGCHIFLEAHVDGRWMVLDPLFDLSFVTPDGRPAGADDIVGNWSYYQDQIPSYRTEADPLAEEYYDVNYFDYGGVRYTNWSKVPILMPALRKMLGWLLGEERASKVSLRTYVLDLNKVHLSISAVLFLACSLLLGYRRLLLRTEAASSSMG